MSTITITDNTIRIGIKSLITKFTGIIPDNVIAAFDNRTPIPKGSYAVMTPIQTTRHATNEDVYSTTAVKNIKAHLTAQYQMISTERRRTVRRIYSQRFGRTVQGWSF